MRKLSVLVAASLIAMTAVVPASAAVNLAKDGNGNSTLYNHVDMDTNTQGVGYNKVFGSFSEDGGAYGVTFQSNELIDTKNGKAFIDPKDGFLESLSFSLTDPTLFFTGFDLDLHKFSAGISSVTVTAFRGNDELLSKVFDLTSISGNKFGIEGSADDGDYFTKIAFSFTGAGNNFGVEQVKAINIGGVGTISTIPAVPEPATWAMLIAGFGLVGAAARRRDRKTVVAA